MSAAVAVPPSPTPSSLFEVKEETRLVLKSFLRHALSIAPEDRPGRIGGTYHDPNKYSVLVKDKEKQNKDESGWDSLDEKISAAEEKKHGIKSFIKRRLKPRPSPGRPTQKDTGTDQSQNGSVSSQGDSSTPVKKHGSYGEDEKYSSPDEESERKMGEKKKKKNKLKLAELFKKKSVKKDDTRPQRPASLPLKEAESGKQPLSPSHPPEFYEGVARKLDRIAQKSVKRKSPNKPEAIQIGKTENDKEAIVKQLVNILTAEGDAINEKIEENPLLRNSLNRMSYASFAKLLDSCANETVIDPPLPVAESPTLRRVAITMEMTRRVVTATGATHRVEGFAECYMETFAPWVKSQGGWENIVQEGQEFD